MQHQIIILLMQIILFFTLISPLIVIEAYNSEYYLTQNKNTLPIKQKHDFLNIMVQNAMQNAYKLHQDAYTLSTKCETEIEKAAWIDCFDLYKEAIDHLNQTITKNTRTKVDAQTWLSSALTLHHTCQNGFNDLGLVKKFMPILSSNVHNNVTSLISNALSINKDSVSPGNMMTATVPPKDGFPNWVKPGDRKLLQSSTSQVRADLTVAQDGSGAYSSIGQAIRAASSGGGRRFVIYIKAGTYNENIEIGLKNIMLLGDGIGRTIITGSKSVGGGATTFRSATVAAVGSGFMAQDITFRNTAGPSNHQAVALRSNSDLSVFYKCSFEGYQDTLYVFSNRQFYRECNMIGTVDFMFGNAAVVIQNCNIMTRRPPAGTNTLTAQGRTDPNQNTGIVIHNCRVSAAESQNGAKTYLGRPWQQYSRTVFMTTYMDGIVSPQGWLEWSGNFALSTLYYAEYANTGPGSSTGNRVNWPGYHVISASEAEKFTVGNFISGGSWLPSTGVPFTSGL